MTETVRQQLCLIAAGVGALTAFVALDVVAGPGPGIAGHETLISLTRRLVLWMTAACFSFVALRPLRPTVGTGR